MTEIVSGFSEASPDGAIASAMSQIINNLGSDAENMVFSVASVWEDESGYHAQVMAVPKTAPSESLEGEEKPLASSQPDDQDETEEADEYYMMGHPYIVPQTDFQREQIEEGQVLIMENTDRPYFEESSQPLYEETEMQKAEDQGSLIEQGPFQAQERNASDLELPQDDILEPKAPDDDAMTLTPDLEEAASDMEEEFEEAKNPANDQIRKPEPVPATSPHLEPDGTAAKEDAS